MIKKILIGLAVIILALGFLPGLPATEVVASPSIVGVEWNQGTDTWTWIDVDGNGIGAPNFGAVSPWQDIVRCTLNADGSENEVSANGKGNDISLDGSTGRVMVRIPRFWIKSDSPGANRYRWWISDAAYAGFVVHPVFYQRGNTAAPTNYIYVGAYEAGSDGSTLRSQTGDTVLVSQTIGTFRTRAENIDSVRWGITSIWSLSAIKLLYYIEYADADSQTTIGQGIVNDAAKSATGADGIDANLATNGTGSGTSTDGSTPIAYRGIENLWGNVRNFIDGYEAVDAEYRIIKRDGSGTFRNPLQAGDYEASTAAPTTTDGYIKNIEYEELLANLFIPDGTAGSDSTYLYDYLYAHDTGEVNILLMGGYWGIGALAGVAHLWSLYVATHSIASSGGRLEFIPETPVAPTVTTQAVSDIATTTATGNGNITDAGSPAPDKRGIVYGTTSKGDPIAVAPPGGYDDYEEESPGPFGTGAFTRSLTGLTPGQIYYARAYAHNSVGYNYGGEVNFYTLPGDPSNLSATTVSDTQIDLTWTRGTGGDKTMVRRAEGDYPANEGAGDQVYFDTGLSYSDVGRTPSTLYYYRAWAYDTEGAQYSSGYTSDTATTLGPPSVTTNAADPVGETTATLKGEITALNDGNATERGFDWGTATGVYPFDWPGEGDFGIGTFDHDLTLLTKGECYYYRAYAIGTYGEGVGAEVKFLTKPDEPTALNAAVAADDDIDLTWVNGAGSDTTYIVRKDGSYPDDRADGTNVYNGALELYHDDDAGLVAGHVYYYRAWSYASEDGESQYSDTYDQDSVILTLGLVLWFQPEAIIEDDGTGDGVLIDRQGAFDGEITWGGRHPDSASLMTLTDSELVQADDYWNGDILKIKETTDGLAPEGEETEILDFTSVTLGGTATSDGLTTTLIDTGLVQTTAYWAAVTITIVTTVDSGAPQGESKVVTTWDLPTNTLTFPAMTAATDEGDTYTLTAADTLFFEALTDVPEAGDRYEIWDGQKILWGSFPSGISVEVGALVAYTSPVSGIVGGEDPEVAEVPQEPSGLWGGAADTDLPLYVLFNAVAGDLGWETEVLYVFAWIIVAIGLGVALLITTGSTLAAIGGVGAGMVGGMATGMLPVWILVVYLILGGTWLYSSRSM